VSNVDILLGRILSQAEVSDRLIVAIAGPPASGKSTLAEKLVNQLNISAGRRRAALLPMDGFHLDNATLRDMDLLSRKGAHQTFDVQGFHQTLLRIRQGREDVWIPLFDRDADAVRNDADCIKADVPIVVVEGNYLLLDREPWRCLAALFDLTVYLQVDVEILKKRLIHRWLEQGLALAAARERALSNDLVNAQLVAENVIAADLILSSKK
jgi:pantothenate kinase